MSVTKTDHSPFVESGEAEAIVLKVPTRLLWVELMKAVALLLIVLNHLAEQIFGYPYIGNPYLGWPPLGDRIAQLAPLTGLGSWTLTANILRYVGWSGDQGVQLFLIVSGFGLTWGLLARHRTSALSLEPFYRRRAARIYPLWWGAHVLFVATWLFVGWGLSLADPELYLSMLGIRFMPNTVYYFSPAWWYVGLVIQLYLVYPLLWRLLQRWGPWRLLLIGCAVGFAARGIGALIFGGYLDAWLRGAIFVTRLPEFVLGMALAGWLAADPDKTQAFLFKPTTLLMALLVYIGGIACSLSLVGMTVAPFMTGLGLFLFLYPILNRYEQPHSRLVKGGAWTGSHTYSLYLMHHPFILALVPTSLLASPTRIWGGILGALVLTIVTGMFLESAVQRATALLGGWRRRVGTTRTVVRLGTVCTVTAMMLIGTELGIRWLDPQEVLGWGERPSLEPHPVYGWLLKPSETTRLRWESYDYEVTANAHGFPGPEYASDKPENALRIMTIGDAYTSAEGVDTDSAWPRLLEVYLREEYPEREVQVFNFAITGYGPNQYAAVIEDWAPELKPDFIVIGLFVNDYLDVLRGNEDFQDSIGFHLPSQDGIYSILRLSHLQKLVKIVVKEPISELLFGRPSPQGYFLGQFVTLERDQSLVVRDGRKRLERKLSDIKEIADGLGSELIVAMIPASVQVCESDALAYYPRYVELSDTSRYDLEQPQRITRGLTESLQIEFYDLRPVLRASTGGCPYQQHNMHWTEEGHNAVALFLAAAIGGNRSIAKAEQ